jgi:hypothetical protein
MREVPVQVVEPPADGDMKALAFSLNSVHGRPLTLSDRREFARHLLQECTALSDSEIGRRSGLSQQTVKVIRTELESASQIERLPVRTGGDGKTYPAYANQTKRQPGELPEEGLLEGVGSALGTLFTPRDRINQRRIAHYLKRLSVALGEQDELEGWDTATEAADAVRAVFGEGRASELAHTLGHASRNVLDVALELGYHDE